MERIKQDATMYLIRTADQTCVAGLVFQLPGLSVARNGEINDAGIELPGGLKREAARQP
ncbi:hypothetical protein SAMN00120144_3802 [Hymenobacter roseosalivarius DSM 11622]|uniref:Uncharacterized protein n=1 Tax=Hymenobacter roseosalivarius DSM 11622 TaxID=645990 RepID=A0A1W1UH18_9BACT|nr:hypothetical protein SAMN00120144_3802 [Hymenobacter roseosalivarius DSM 11622]